MGLLYVISPIDLLPEIAIPVLGVADDLAVLSLALPKLLKEVDRFLLWEAEKIGNIRNISDAEIID
ncbi:YkvA family protein [Marnyiella aurantia]|uniref:YkvA family protein n=1 Tax=Marnyiella aurantia TaxID=2758037 RepID=UPI0029620754|nr:YkvA family protein [Marnyiella aurantia]